MSGRVTRGDVIRHALLACACIVALYPVVWMVTGSLGRSSAGLVSGGFLPLDHVTLSNYPRAWRSGGFARPLLNSVIVTGCQIAINMVISSLAGFGFAKYRFRGRHWLLLAVIALTLLPIQMIIIPLFLIVRHLGWQNSYEGLIVPTAASALAVLIMRQHISSIPDELIEAGRLDGARDLRIWYQIVLPLSRPALLTVGVLTALTSWDQLIWPLVLVSTTNMTTMPLALAALNSVYQAPLTWLMAMATVMALPPVLAFCLSQGKLVENVGLAAAFR